MMILTRRSFAVSLGSLAATAASALRLPADAQSRVVLNIGVLPPSDISAEPYYAKDLGLFSAAGIDANIESLANGSALVSAVIGGDFNVAFSNVISLATARGRGIKIVILAPANLHVQGKPTAGILAVKKTSSIFTAKDFAGKVVAVDGLNNIAEISCRAWIDANGGDSKAVKFVEVTFSSMVPAVVAGRVDGAVMNAIYDTTRGKPDDPLRRIGSSTFDAIARTFSPSVWYSTPDWVDAHRSTALAFVKAMREAATWANAHTADSAKILSHYTKQSVADIQSVQRVIYGGAITPALVQPAIDVAAKYGLLSERFPATEIIANLS